MNFNKLTTLLFFTKKIWCLALMIFISCESQELTYYYTNDSTALLNTATSSFIPNETFIPLQENEYKLKAAFIYQFTEYINWVNSQKSTFNIAILGNSELTKNLKEIAGRKKVKNKPIEINEYTSLSSIESCDILFISEASGVSVSQALHKFQKTNTLIVTEKDGAKNQGAHINFIRVGDKVKFEVNLKSAKRSGITISSELLKHATDVAK